MATVDGDARRSRRYSSDESTVGGGSVTELDRTEYLTGYQQSTPMQPGKTHTNSPHTHTHTHTHQQPCTTQFQLCMNGIAKHLAMYACTHSFPPAACINEYTFLSPGQRMGEYEMFARPRDSENPERPFRPSLQDCQWTQPQGNRTSHM